MIDAISLEWKFEQMEELKTKLYRTKC